MNMRFGVTGTFSCSYLPEQQERLIVHMDDKPAQAEDYQTLITLGFRRSGTQVYRPHCPHCHACESLRVPVAEFRPSRSQKRVVRKNAELQLRISHTDKPEYYPLYQAYISDRHRDGSMYPPTKEQYDNFILCPWLPQQFVEMWDKDKLIGVMVTDELPQALSALYTFFLPEYAPRSLGTFAILSQIDLCKAQNRPYLYLGYQIDGCAKMNYKAKFLPHERFRQNEWQLITK